MDRSAALNAAIAAVADRPNQYGKPEQNFERIANLWNAHVGNNDDTYKPGDIYFHPEDVAIMLALVKIARLEADPTHADSWIDLAGYAGCGAEVSGADDHGSYGNRGVRPSSRPAQNSDLVDDVLSRCPGRNEECLIRFPKTKFGFTVGETVNLGMCAVGRDPGIVIGFDGAHVRVRAAQGDQQEWGFISPSRLRHGI